MLEFPSFLRLNSIPLYVSPTFVYSFNCRWTFGVSPPFGCCEYCCYEGARAPTFQCLGHIPRSGIVESYDSSTLNFFKETTYHFPQQLHHSTFPRSHFSQFAVCWPVAFSTLAWLCSRQHPHVSRSTGSLGVEEPCSGV